ncbi:hypothetical protein DPMN_066528 [Dreissena polymorpha]|uniref:Orn/DAP/Arg decarboxylase 2 C-terminal domain-containing protein n=1 Tax=Dreissena polymorpha TaxID=45954 RepID=A0A9D4BKK7_DREPO|nr:hypothetical protein DPMN_066528 [Dreissena polymorpha]
MTLESSVWRPTCDGIDCVLKKVQLPMLEVDDWFYFEKIGAYTVSTACAFNGMQTPRRVYFCDAAVWLVV